MGNTGKIYNTKDLKEQMRDSVDHISYSSCTYNDENKEKINVPSNLDLFSEIYDINNVFSTLNLAKLHNEIDKLIMFLMDENYNLNEKYIKLSDNYSRLLSDFRNYKKVPKNISDYINELENGNYDEKSLIESIKAFVINKENELKDKDRQISSQKEVIDSYNAAYNDQNRDYIDELIKNIKIKDGSIDYLTTKNTKLEEENKLYIEKYINLLEKYNNSILRYKYSNNQLKTIESWLKGLKINLISERITREGIVRGIESSLDNILSNYEVYLDNTDTEITKSIDINVISDEINEIKDYLRKYLEEKEQISYVKPINPHKDIDNEDINEIKTENQDLIVNLDEINDDEIKTGVIENEINKENIDSELIEAENDVDDIDKIDLDKELSQLGEIPSENELNELIELDSQDELDELDEFLEEMKPFKDVDDESNNEEELNDTSDIELEDKESEMDLENIDNGNLKGIDNINNSKEAEINVSDLKEMLNKALDDNSSVQNKSKISEISDNTINMGDKSVNIPEIQKKDENEDVQVDENSNKNVIDLTWTNKDGNMDVKMSEDNPINMEFGTEESEEKEIDINDILLDGISSNPSMQAQNTADKAENDYESKSVIGKITKERTKTAIDSLTVEDNALNAKEDESELGNDEFELENDGFGTENGGSDIENDGSELEKLGIKLENRGLGPENGGLYIENGGLDTENNGLDIENDSFDLENGGLDIENNGLNIENKGLNIENNGLDTENDGLNTENNGLSAENGHQNIETGHNGSEISGLEIDLSSLKSSSNEEIPDIEQEPTKEDENKSENTEKGDVVDNDNIDLSINLSEKEIEEINELVEEETRPEDYDIDITTIKVDENIKDSTNEIKISPNEKDNAENKGNSDEVTEDILENFSLDDINIEDLNI